MTTFDTQAFLAHNRIHVEHGSVFYDQLVQVHPRELAPERESALVAKLGRIWQQDAPSFFSSYPRGAVAQMFGSLVPLSAQARKASLKEQQDALSAFEKHGVDATYQKEWQSRQTPFAALVGQDAEAPATPAAAKEYLQNGFMLYLVMDEALSRKGFPKELVQYLKRGGSLESLLSDLEPLLGVSPHRIMDIAATQGVEGVGKALGVDAAFIHDVKELAAMGAAAHFSDNIYQHWQIGRHMPGKENAPTQQKIEAGKLPRIAYAIQQMRAQVGYHYDVPAPIAETEARVAATLRRLPPVMQEALFAIGAEISYTPEMTLDAIAPGARAHGYHLKLTKNPGDVDGLYQIFLSGKEDAEAFARVLVHEAHHLFFPQRSAPEEVKRVDALAGSDFARLTDLKLMMDAWRLVATPSQREAIEWKIATDYGVGGLSLREALGGRTMEQFADLVSHAYDRLNIHSHFFSKTAYNTAPEKFYEVVARYSELRFVALEDNPNLLRFIAPGLSELYDKHYLPHVAAQLTELKESGLTAKPESANDNAPTRPISIAADAQALAVPASLVAQRSLPSTHLQANAVQFLEPLQVHGVEGAEAMIGDAAQHGYSR